MFKIYALLSICLSLLLIPSIAKAQVNGPGPSDPALFDTVINRPPSDSDFRGNIGGVTGQTTQFNVMEGGFESTIRANSGSEVNISGGTVGSGFRANSGSEVNISSGTVGWNFSANSGSLVNISGGTVGLGFDANSGSVVTISGGNVDRGFRANSGSMVNISEGTVGTGFRASSGSVVNISGGNVDRGFRANSGSLVNISGGTVGISFDAFSGSVININGGFVGNNFDAFSGSEVNLVGTKFLLDGVLLESLDQGEVFIITERNLTLSGLLADGTPFDFDLNGTRTRTFDEDFFDPGSMLTVTLVQVPEPGSLLLGALASVGVLIRKI